MKEDPIEMELLDAFDMMVESGSLYRHRLRLLDTESAEIASVTGTMMLGSDRLNEGDWAEVAISDGGFTATLRIPLDPGTTCTVDRDGVVVAKLPSGASWVWEPDIEGSEEDED